MASTSTTLGSNPHFIPSSHTHTHNTLQRQTQGWQTLRCTPPLLLHVFDGECFAAKKMKEDTRAGDGPPADGGGEGDGSSGRKIITSTNNNNNDGEDDEYGESSYEYGTDGFESDGVHGDVNYKGVEDEGDVRGPSLLVMKTMRQDNFQVQLWVGNGPFVFLSYPYRIPI